MIQMIIAAKIKIRLFLIAVLFSMTICGYSQLITGRIIHLDSDEPLYEVWVTLNGTTSGCNVDSNGFFKFERFPIDTLDIFTQSYYYNIGYSSLIIYNIPNNDTIDLGNIYLVSVPIKLGDSDRNRWRRVHEKNDRKNRRKYRVFEMTFNFKDIKVPEGYIMKATKSKYYYEIDYNDLKTKQQ